MSRYGYVGLVSFITFSLLYGSSCNFNIDLDWGPNLPPPAAVPQDKIAGNYEGEIKYWVNDQDYLLALSKENGYLTTITRNIDERSFTITFDSSFIYNVPNLDFKVINSPYLNSIQLDSGQSYTNWDPENRSTNAGNFYIDYGAQDTTISFGLNIQDLLADSTYYLTFYGRRKL